MVGRANQCNFTVLKTNLFQPQPDLFAYYLLGSVESKTAHPKVSRLASIRRRNNQSSDGDIPSSCKIDKNRFNTFRYMLTAAIT